MTVSEFPLLSPECLKAVYTAVLSTALPGVFTAGSGSGSVAHLHVAIWLCRERIFAVAGVLDCYREDEMALSELMACVLSLGDNDCSSGNSSGENGDAVARLCAGVFLFVTNKLIAEWGVGLSPEEAK